MGCVCGCVVLHDFGLAMTLGSLKKRHNNNFIFSKQISDAVIMIQWGSELRTRPVF